MPPARTGRMLQNAGLPFDADEMVEDPIPLQRHGIPLPPVDRPVLIRTTGDRQLVGKVSTHFNEGSARPTIEVQYNQTHSGGNNTQFRWSSERRRYESPDDKGLVWLDLDAPAPDPGAPVFKFCPECGVELEDGACSKHGAP